MRFLGLALALVISSLRVQALISPTSLDKARVKLEDLSRTRQPSVLIVDGNNVRGQSPTRWSPSQWMQRVEQVRDAYGIDHSVVVWDHGPAKLIDVPPDYCSSPTIGLFSGPSQRADDLLVQEAPHWRDSFGAASDFRHLCFVTNDNGLRQRLRRLGSNPHLRVENTHGPLLLDSTRFGELAGEVCATTEFYDSTFAQEAASNLRAFQQHPSNVRSKREPTWQRCVLAHALVQEYCRCHNEREIPQEDMRGRSQQVQAYLASAQQRGFQAIHQDPDLVSTIVRGSNRLDKKQKQILGQYNKFVAKRTDQG